MKTAISIPEQTFRKADRAAKQRGMSRSQLITTAIEEYLQKDEKANLTARMNEMCDSVGDTSLAPDIRDAQLRILRREAW